MKDEMIFFYYVFAICYFLRCKDDQMILFCMVFEKCYFLRCKEDKKHFILLGVFNVTFNVDFEWFLKVFNTGQVFEKCYFLRCKEDKITQGFFSFY